MKIDQTLNKFGMTVLPNPAEKEWLVAWNFIVSFETQPDSSCILYLKHTIYLSLKTTVFTNLWVMCCRDQTEG